MQIKEFAKNSLCLQNGFLTAFVALVSVLWIIITSAHLGIYLSQVSEKNTSSKGVETTVINYTFEGKPYTQNVRLTYSINTEGKVTNLNSSLGDTQ